MKSLCVYCGSNPGARPAYTEIARELGQAMASQGIRLVYGGAKVGLMGSIADAVLAAGGEAIGVIPGALVELEVAHQGLTELHVVKSMHERKTLMAELSEGFIAMPGGIGTFEELFEIWTWAHLGLHKHPIGLLNVEGYYDHLLRFLEHAQGEGYLKAAPAQLLLVHSEVDGLMEKMRSYIPPDIAPVIRASQT